jgi:hypothetical protein
MFLGKRRVFRNGPQYDRLTVAFNFQENAISRVPQEYPSADFGCVYACITDNLLRDFVPVQ